MKRIALALLLFLAFPMVVSAADSPTEDSLITAWEALQKSSANTVTLEKIADRRYKYKTNLFPFDGELKINDATVESMGSGPYNDFTLGLLDVELIDLPKDVPQKYSRKYSMWQRNNTLYYEKKTGKWLSPQEFQNVISKMNMDKSKPSGLFSDYMILVVLLLALGYVIYFLQKNKQAVKTSLQRQTDAIAQVDKSIKLSERSIQVGEETNKILKEILYSLKSKG